MHYHMRLQSNAAWQNVRPRKMHLQPLALDGLRAMLPYSEMIPTGNGCGVSMMRVYGGAPVIGL